MPALPLNVGVVSLVLEPPAGEVRVTTGAPVSTVNVRVVPAFAAWVLPTLSVAHTRNVCDPAPTV